MKQLLFVDTNIWLDFYRARTEAGMSLLDHLDSIRDVLIITHQVEMEFKKNRQSAILEGFKAMRGPETVLRPGLFSTAKSAIALQRDIRNAEKRVNNLKDRLRRALDKPAVNDPVYKVFQRCCHKDDDLALTRSSDEKPLIRRRAFRRFLVGCPPRKCGDTSIGDAVNWEWLVRCAIKHEAEIHIASRDSDYGITFEGRAYVNDHLLQEFRERVSKKRGLFLHSRLSDALKKFSVKITSEEEKEEEAIISSEKPKVVPEVVPSPALYDLLADSVLADEAYIKEFLMKLGIASPTAPAPDTAVTVTAEAPALSSAKDLIRPPNVPPRTT